MVAVSRVSVDAAESADRWCVTVAFFFLCVGGSDIGQQVGQLFAGVAVRYLLTRCSGICWRGARVLLFRSNEHLLAIWRYRVMHVCGCACYASR